MPSQAPCSGIVVGGSRDVDNVSSSVGVRARSFSPPTGRGDRQSGMRARPTRRRGPAACSRHSFWFWHHISMAFSLRSPPRKWLKRQLLKAPFHSPQTCRHAVGRRRRRHGRASSGLRGPRCCHGWTRVADGWAIPCATDIAFSYLVARVIFGATHPAIPFLLLLAIADDALGLAILAVFYPSGTLRLLDFVVICRDRYRDGDRDRFAPRAH